MTGLAIFICFQWSHIRGPGGGCAAGVFKLNYLRSLSRSWRGASGLKGRDSGFCWEFSFDEAKAGARSASF